MSNRRPSPEHQQAVARRLALLSAELAGSRPQPAQEIEEEGGWASGHTRIRPATPAEPWAQPAKSTTARSRLPLPAAEPPVIPAPGRHASRGTTRGRDRGEGRAGGRLGDLVPTTIRGRVALGPAQLAMVAVLVAAGLAVTCWWVVRGDADRLEAPAIEPTAALASTAALADASPVAAGAASSASTAGTAGTAGSGQVTVDVTGKVRRPGIAVLDAGARVVDALKAAGGARPGVDLSSLNLARVLVDGEQVVVGQPAALPVASPGVPTSGAPGGPLVNLNTASQTELEALPEVGPVTAQAILAWREEHGGFTSVDELLEVDGIGDATLAQLAPFVSV